MQEILPNLRGTPGDGRSHITSMSGVSGVKAEITAVLIQHNLKTAPNFEPPDPADKVHCARSVVDDAEHEDGTRMERGPEVRGLLNSRYG